MVAQLYSENHEVHFLIVHFNLGTLYIISLNSQITFINSFSLFLVQWEK